MKEPGKGDPGQPRQNIEFSLSNNPGLSVGGGLTAWRLGSAPAVTLFKAYQKIKALCVSFIQKHKSLGRVAETHDGILFKYLILYIPIYTEATLGDGL